MMLGVGHLRVLSAIALAVLIAAPVSAEERSRPAAAARRRKVETNLFIEVPLDYDTSVKFPFGGSHQTVPGTVAVNRAPYYCQRHDKAFAERPGFVAHLRVEHGLEDRDIPAAVLVEGGQVRYIGQ